MLTLMRKYTQTNMEAKMRISGFLVAICSILFHPPLFAEDTERSELEKDAESDPVASLKTSEQGWLSKGVTLLPHYANYILPISYNDKLNTLHDNYLDTEIKFQISIKTPVYMLNDDLSSGLWAAYTQQSYWQAYAHDISAPFRETNYQPELFWEQNLSLENGHTSLEFIRLGFNHQSNGQSQPTSRSWNRIYTEFAGQLSPKFQYNTKLWHRISEEQKTYDNEAAGDDNPNLTEYLGHGEIYINYLISNRYRMGVMLRNNIESNFERGAAQIDFSGPMGHYLRWYVQLYSGYGENLINYDQYTNRIGVGFEINAWRLDS